MAWFIVCLTFFTEDYLLPGKIRYVAFTYSLAMLF